MTNSADHGVRRYSDLLTAGFFKTGADGRKIFYPWGMLGNGYIIPSNNEYKRLNNLLKIYVVVALLVILPPAVSGFYFAVPGSNLAATIVMVLALVFYWVWMRFELPGLQRTQEKPTYRVGITNFARLAPGWLLWAEEIAALVFVAGGIIMLITQPDRWMIALFSILFFGAGAVMCAVMLVLRRRPAREQS